MSFSKGTSLSVAVLTGPDASSIKRQIGTAQEKADIFELRLDLFESRNLPELPALPYLFTFGALPEEEIERICIQYAPSMVDLPSSLSLSFVQKIRSLLPEAKIILSHHDFDQVPDLEKLSLTLSAFPADLYKIAVTPSSFADAKRVLAFHTKSPAHWNLVPMGESFTWARVLRHKYKSAMEYFFLEKKTGPGQLPLHTTYVLPSQSTALYGLIGNPVEQSPSHITHNALFAHLGKNALYLKISLPEEELAPFLAWAPEVGFEGLSVTAPFKEKVVALLPLLCSEAAKIGAINTIRYEKGEGRGFNTDGEGAVAALAIPLTGKKILLIGAGGTARAIAYAARKAGALVTVTCRSEEKAEAFALALSCEMIHWEEKEKEKEAIVINATPEESLFPGSLNVNLREASPFALALFQEQAARQFALWFHAEEKVSEFRESLADYCITPVSR